jgi:hypothetical protein
MLKNFRIFMMCEIPSTFNGNKCSYHVIPSGFLLYQVLIANPSEWKILNYNFN